MSILTCVLVHKEAQECFDLHLPYWKGWTDKILVYSPNDSRIETQERQISWGHAEHHGAHSVERLHWLLLWISGTDFDHFAIHEYDSVSFGPFSNEVKDGRPTALWGNWFESIPDPRWIGQSFVQAPFFLNRFALDTLIAAMGRFPFHACQGYYDRFLGACVEAHGMEKGNWGKDGFSVNSIHDGHLEAAVEARKSGAIHFHGIKNAEVLEALK